MKYHDYIWDLGGTLLDNYSSSARAFGETLTFFGLSATYEEIYTALKVSTDFAIEKFIPDTPSFRPLYKQREAFYLEEPVLFDGVPELLSAIVNTGARNFLVSHRDHHVIEIMEKTGIAQFFTEIVTAENGFARKPNPASMLYLKEKYQISHGLVIGDREIDLQAGQAAGLATYLIDDAHKLVCLLDF